MVTTTNPKIAVEEKFDWIQPSENPPPLLSLESKANEMKDSLMGRFDNLP
jgi:hypothetical protein